MAKVTAPLLGFASGGQIGKSQVYASWKGRAYARRYVKPANPNSTAQQGVRNPFKWLMAVWKVSPTLFQDPWTAYAKGQVLTNRNALAKFNVPVLQAATDLTGMVFSPGAGGGLPPTSITVTAGTGQLTVAFTNPATPSGWTLVSAIAAAIKSQNPQSGTMYDMTAGQDTSTMDSVVLTGLTASQSYEVGAWLKWTKADGTTAYSPSILGTGTPT